MGGTSKNRIEIRFQEEHSAEDALVWETVSETFPNATEAGKWLQENASSGYTYQIIRPLGSIITVKEETKLVFQKA